MAESIKIAIIGGGISGLATGFYLRQKFGKTFDLMIFERSAHLGGTIGITRQGGYLADWGPNGFLDREPLTLEFVEQVGLTGKLYRANEQSEKRFIFRNNRLWPIAPHPLRFLTSGLLSIGGRLRVLKEYFVPAKTDDADESIFDFTARRIGKEAAETMIDPMVSGVFGGDARKLSLAACFPRMSEMEENYGGLIRAMRQIKKERRGQAQKGDAGSPTGHLTSFHGGFYTLIERLGEILRDDLRLATPITRIARTSKGKYQVVTKRDNHVFDHVVIAVPTYAAADMLENTDRPLAKLLQEIEYSSLAVACQGYNISDVGRKLDGFGFLIPSNQNRNILGSIWTSVIFPEQAPKGQVLLRTMLGGARNNYIIDLGEKVLAELAHQELAAIMDIRAEPVFEKIITWKNAIPQYTLGHFRRMGRIEARLEKLPNLHLAGNAYTGVSLNDLIKRAHRIVHEDFAFS